MYFNKQLQKGVAVLIAVAACSDGAPPVVAPVQQGQQPAIPAGRIPESDERVIVTRTIDAQGYAADGQARPPRERRTKTFTFGARTISARHDSGSAMPGAVKVRVRAKPTSADDLPIVGLTISARRTSFRNAVAPWRRSLPMPDDSATMIESFGTGDAPPSVMHVSRNGVPLMTITQEWELWQSQWQLVRRETISPDSGFREVIDVQRTGRIGTALQSPVDWSQRVGRSGTLAPSFDLYGGEDNSGCPACAALDGAVTDNYQFLMGALILADAACAIPNLYVAPACLVALVGVWAAEVRFNRAVANRDQCNENPVTCPPKPPKRDDCSIHAAGARTFTASFACGAAGGSGGGGSNTPSYHTECTYYYEYDMDTGAILYSELLYCQSVADN